MSALPPSQPPDEHPENTFESIFTLPKLRKTSQTIRKEVRLLRARDVIDWLDWFIALESSLPLLRTEILTGNYTPTPPTRYELAKARGSFRVITALNIRDAVVYRHISDETLTRATPFKVQGAFFSRRRTSTPVGKTFLLEDDPYLKFFDIWLRYQEYRTHTLLNESYEFIVVSDITNYFDSIQHDLLLEYLSPLGLPRKVVGLLGRLLEAFKPSAGHSPNPRVGLPVDELDCSRELAHLFLFEHDRRMIEEFGEDNYVRWMDDQNIGVETETKARRVVNELTRSLACQRLTLNTGKTRFLSIEHVVVHFQLDANVALSRWDKEFNTVTEANRLEARKEFEEIWAKISVGKHVGQGYWEKILKRVYGLAVRADSNVLEERALNDLIQYPELDERIFTYFAKRNQAEELLELSNFSAL
jgi:Reverse transcriptase (RNA-dependent DNA polymerase)